MANKKFFGAEALVGLLLTVLAFVASIFSFAPTETLENKLYDWRLRTLPVPAPSEDIRLVAIDAPSLEALGRWPWPRSLIADLLRRIATGEPRVLGCGILFSELDENPGLMAVRELKEEYQSLLHNEEAAFAPLLQRLSKDLRYKKEVRQHPFGDLRGFGQTLGEVAKDLDNDAHLMEIFSRARHVLLSFYFRSLGRGGGEETPEGVERLAQVGLLQSQVEGRGGLPEGAMPLFPRPEFAKRVEGLGNTTVIQDSDGAVRRESPVMVSRGQYVPSLALQMARVAMNLKLKDIRVRLGQEILLGKTRIPLDADSKMLIKFAGGMDHIKTDSAVDVLRENGGIPSKTYKDKLVLVGITDSGLGSSFVTPVDSAFQFNGLVLSALRNIWEGRFLSRPKWVLVLEGAWLGLMGLFAAFALPLLRARSALLITLGLGVATAALGWYLFLVQSVWMKIFYSLAVLIASYAVITVRRFFFMEMKKEWMEVQTIESNKSLGLSYQTQGLLDMSFEKLRKCPVDADMQGILYNLALDFERKRQFGKAGVVYDHIAVVNPRYKDIASRAKTAKEVEGSGGGFSGGAKPGGTLVLSAGSAKPTLGRYEIEKELGRGAMGVVYLGRDPKINRSVAIKTLRFDEGSDAETAKTIRERFFREAESAGTLNHPNILRVFDAGEDGDISYIAMELLDGEDLKKYIDPTHLLPVPLLVEYTATVADALDFAHAHGVVHRDIKPANIMILKDGTLRVTDFGIARITSTSKTATGTVLGTPSYMSPEQLSGKKVDGRSDLFSLGVMLYEMLAGEKPFDGDSIATLMFKIAHEDPPDPRLKRPDRINDVVQAVLRRALAKDPDQRYCRGAEMARDLRAALLSARGLPSVNDDTRELVAKPPSPQEVGDALNLGAPPGGPRS